jgi:starch synthase
MKILFVSPEITPFAKSGGLANVAKALPEAIHSVGHDIRTIMPKYLSIAQQNLAMDQVTALTVQTHHGHEKGESLSLGFGNKLPV